MEEYPKKYVVMCLIKPGISSNEYSNIDNMMGYYVSSAYLIENIDDEYVVALSHYPEFTKDNVLINGSIVDRIYDTKDAAIKNRDRLNNKLVNDKVSIAYEKYLNNKIDRMNLIKAKIDAESDLSECEEYEFSLDAIEVEMELKKRK